MASFVAPAALSWLEQTRHAQVLHVFEHACNLINDQGEILSLVTPEIGPGPLAVVAPIGATNGGFAVLVDANAQVQVNRLTPSPYPFHAGMSEIGSFALGRLTIDASTAQIWNPRPPWELLQRKPVLLAAQRAHLAALLQRHAPSDSLAAMMGIGVNSIRRPMSRKLIDSARDPIRRLRLGIAADDATTYRAGARGLAGLGSGLTPAGDDFLVGAMHALWATRPPDDARRLATAIAVEVTPRTSSLSAAWLHAAARGEAGAPWHDLVGALAVNDSTVLRKAVLATLATGHTSGADALAGFVAIVTPATSLAIAFGANINYT